MNHWNYFQIIFYKDCIKLNFYKLLIILSILKPSSVVTNITRLSGNLQSKTI